MLDEAIASSQSITIDGVSLETKFIPGTKVNAPTLILLHEGLGCIDMWRDFPENLAEATGHPVFVYSRQGYGRSDPCDLPRPLSYMHIEGQQVLPKVLAAAGINEHILLGHSDGGSIALINAGSCPAKGLRAVITMAPHIFCEELTISSIEKSCDFYNQGDLRKGLARYHFDNVDTTFWGWNKAWLDPEFVNWNIEEFLPGISVPQLVIQGSDDPYGTMAQVRGIEKKSACSVSTCVLADCKHSPYKEKQEDSISAIKHFLQQVL